MNRFILAALCFAWFAAKAGCAAAQTQHDLSCVLEAGGKDVRWDSFWQPDRQDHDVVYRILTVEELRKHNEPRSVQLRLRALGAAHQPERKANIFLEHAAKMFCERLLGYAAPKKKGVLVALGGEDASRARSQPIDAVYAVREVVPDELGFRLPRSGRWVPASPRPGERLFVCHVGSQSYACTQEDFEKVRDAQLRTGRPAEPRFKTVLPHPFIRHTADGWKRAEPLNLPAQKTIAECEAAGRIFNCLPEEKRTYGAELKRLAREMELEQKVFSKKPIPAKRQPAAKQAKKHSR